MPEHTMMAPGSPLGLVTGALLVLLATAYSLASGRTVRGGGGWPLARNACWYSGLACLAWALLGHTGDGFQGHMVGHLLLGMAGPLLLVLAAPVTLALRTLPLAGARRLSHALATRPVRLLTHPVVAALLDMGGLWMLYRTGLYAAAEARPWLLVLVHAHVVLAGYLFTAAIVGTDPMPHRPGRPVRAGVLVLALAAHDILATSLYAHPPDGVPADQARSGAQLMYYGGDVVDVALVVVFCAQWYAAARRADARALRSPRPVTA